MREKIIFAPGAGGTELIKNLAIHGVNCINQKIMGAGEFAEYVLMKSGVPVKEEFVSTKEEYTYIAKAVAGEDYFGKPRYSDIKQIAKAVKCMRGLVPDGDEAAALENILSKGIFTEKNAALVSTYKKYMKLLEGDNAIDSTALVRKAVSEGKPFDADFAMLTEYPLSPLEKRLFDKISGGKYEEISLENLYKAGKKAVKAESYKNCYGAPNEVETIINDIYKGKDLDKCLVAVTDPGTYSQLFFDYALLYDIPVTFGCGVPIMNSNPGRLLVMYYHWMTDGFFGKDALNAMLHSKAFSRAAWKEQFPAVDKNFPRKKFYEVLGNLRLTNNADTNAERLAGYRKAIEEEEKTVRATDEKAYTDFCQRKMFIPYLEIASRELTLYTEEFIAKYSYIRRGSSTNAELLLMKLDMSAADAIYDELGVIRRSGIEQSADDMILNALQISVCGEKSEAGRLHITDIAGAAASIRENVYIAGLSASKFPGSPKENYLLLDTDIRLFDRAPEYLTSEGKIKRKRSQLLELVHLAADLDSKIYVSYSGLNVSELKKDNASSLLYELFREESGKNVTYAQLEEKIEKIDYFEPAISATREIGKAYNSGMSFPEPAVSFDRDYDVKGNIDREWSPSAINMYFTDPVSFMMVYFMNIPEAEATDPFDVISPIAAGNLAHTLMERLANSDMGKDEFLGMAGEYFDRFVTMNPPLISDKADEAKTEFLDMMEKAYEGDSHREVVLKEEDVHCVHESGVKLYGLPDRVEKLDDGTYLIVDFKSGRNVKHVQDDINTCLQVVIYAYMMEKQGMRVSGGEFRYLRTGDVVTCRYDDEMKKALDARLNEFKQGIEAFCFEQAPNVLDDSGDAGDENPGEGF